MEVYMINNEDNNIIEKYGKILSILIFIFPIIIEVLIFIFTKNKENIDKCDYIKNFFSIGRVYQSYYATAFTLTLGIRSYISQQHKLIEERKNTRRAILDQQEEKRNFYRPIFSVEKIDNSRIEVKLLMKSNDLYLERVKLYPTSDSYITKKMQLKSGSYIEGATKYPFFITAQTLIGETILFACFSDDKKLYKFLKYDKDPSFPLSDEDIHHQKEINNTWKSYNTPLKKRYNNLDPLFFKLTINIRNQLKEDFSWLFSKSLMSESATEFFKNIFYEFNNKNMQNETYNEKVYELLKYYIKTLQKHKDYIYNFEGEKIKFSLDSEFINKNSGVRYYKNKPLTISLFLKIILGYIDYFQKDKNNTELKIQDILNILHSAFNTVEISDQLNTKLNEFKIKIFDLNI